MIIAALALIVLLALVFVSTHWYMIAELKQIESDLAYERKINLNFEERIIFLEAGLNVIVNEFSKDIKPRIDQEKLYLTHEHNETEI